MWNVIQFVDMQLIVSAKLIIKCNKKELFRINNYQFVQTSVKVANHIKKRGFYIKTMGSHRFFNFNFAAKKEEKHYEEYIS